MTPLFRNLDIRQKGKTTGETGCVTGTLNVLKYIVHGAGDYNLIHFLLLYVTFYPASGNIIDHNNLWQCGQSIRPVSYAAPLMCRT